MPPPKGKRECKFFASGRCTRGDSCRFSHGDGSPATAATRDPPPDSDVIQPADDAAARCESTHGDADADAPLSEEVQDELDVLLEIYGDEVVIRDRTITMTLRPRTTHQLVRVTALIELPPRYPDMAPTLTLLRPLGLSERSIAALRALVGETVAEHAGTPVAFQMLECMVDFVSEHSLPSECCAICRGDFSAPTHVLVTSCEHFLHPWCTRDYTHHVGGGGGGDGGGAGAELPTAALCPVCRTELNLQELCERVASLEANGATKADDEDDNSAEGSAAWRTDAVVAAQAARELVRARQAERGGLISAKVEILIRELDTSANDVPPSEVVGEAPADGVA